jgi:hypothetical protein
MSVVVGNADTQPKCGLTLTHVEICRRMRRVLYLPKARDYTTIEEFPKRVFDLSLITTLFPKIW